MKKADNRQIEVKTMIKKAFLLFILGCFVLPMRAQNTSTQGKEFWLSFIGNGFKTRYDTYTGTPQFTWLRIQLIVSAKRDCHCTVRNPNTGYERSFQVEANSTYLFDDIPWEEAYMELQEHGQILNKGLLVTADDTISVYCANIAEMSFDASYILPTPALGNDYIIQTYDQSTNSGVYGNYYTSAFLIVAAEEGETTVNIIPSVNTLDGHTANQEYSITLRQGEAYQVRSDNNYYGSRDLSGTRVTALYCKKIAVFNGNNLTMVPNGGSDSDCVFEQAMPLTAWGKQFVVTASLGRQLNDYVKITSAHDNNEIRRNGVTLTTLDAGESITFELQQSNKSCFIEASSSCAVYLYNHSKDPDGWDQLGIGAPSMVWIAPIEQRINNITFSTFNYESEHDTDIDNHYVNIIVSADDIQHVYLDDELLSPLEFEAVNGTTGYCFIRKQINHGVHHISCVNGFNAHVYGFAHARSYAYLVGSNAINLSTNVSVNNIQLQPNEVFPYCAEETVTFSANINFPNAEVIWDFGDGTTSTDNPTTHIYHERRLFEASLFVEADASDCIGGSSDSLVFYIDATQQYITANDEVCIGQPYSGYGFNNVYITNDTILTRLVDNPIHPECKDSLLVHITTHEEFHDPLTDMRCWTGEPALYHDHGFSFMYNSPGVIEQTLSLESVGGCDSIITLTLTVNRPIQHAFDTTVCSTFVWDGIEYNHEDIIEHTYNASNGCDSIVTCHLNVEGTVYGEPWVKDTCNSFIWNGIEYQETAIHQQNLTSFMGCDSIAFLDLRLTYTPSPKITCDTPGATIYGPSADTVAVINNTEFFSFRYDFYVEDTLGHINDWDSCVWSISKPSWSIDTTTLVGDPNKRYCRVYVAEHTDTIVKLSARVVNHKCIDSERTTVIYLKSSFLDVDEQNTVIPDFSIVPNPNNGQMMLNFVNLTGKIDVKVYDMRGVLIDNIQTYNTTGSSTYTYDMKPKSKGLYLFIANGKEGTLRKKIIVK